MLIRNKKAFNRGLLLMASFLVVFVIFFMPVFPAQEEGGEKTNGLVFADHLFNTLSKGSSNFLTPEADGSIVQSTQTATEGKSVAIDVPFKEAAAAEAAQKLLAAQGFEASATDTTLTMKGELYPMLKTVLEDSLSMYNNKVDEVSARHNGEDGRGIMKTWWSLLSAMIKPMQRAGLVSEATAVNTVITKGIEPSYNFYGVTPMRVVDNIPLVAGFLIFYVVYTMWYGFAIFELFEGIGLTMKKSAKSEA